MNEKQPLADFVADEFDEAIMQLDAVAKAARIAYCFWADGHLEDHDMRALDEALTAAGYPERGKVGA